jgi:membrane fusion protein
MEGASATAGQRLLSILPQGAPLEAELLVPSVSIGFVKTGSNVSLHYQSFPYEKFGVQKGVVTHVSSTALTPDEITEVMGTKPPDEALYRVSVQILQQTVSAYGHAMPLKAGMLIEANILLDDRRISEWIFEPLYALSRSDSPIGTRQ